MVFAAIYLLPSISHILPVPLYWLEPMRIGMLTGYILTRNMWNGILLGVSIPIFSLITSGHPELYKAILISFELTVNVFILALAYKKYQLPPTLMLIGSIIVSKVAYYAMKHLFMVFGLLGGNLISTGVINQLLALAVIAVLFSLFMPKKIDDQ